MTVFVTCDRSSVKCISVTNDITKHQLSVSFTHNDGVFCVLSKSLVVKGIPSVLMTFFPIKLKARQIY